MQNRLPTFNLHRSPDVPVVPLVTVKETKKQPKKEAIKTFGTRLPEDVIKRLKKYAADKGMKVQELMPVIVCDYLDRKGG